MQSNKIFEPTDVQVPTKVKQGDTGLVLVLTHCKQVYSQSIWSHICVLFIDDFTV